MGKKSKLKAIRRLANQLPKIQVTVRHGETITGAEAIAKGVNEIAGKAVNPKAMYTMKTDEKVPWNHNRKMKGIYNKYGGAGVQKYLESVQEWAKKNPVKNVEAIPVGQL